MFRWGMAIVLISVTLLLSAAAEPAAEPAASADATVNFGESVGATVQPIESSIWIDADPQTVWDHAVKDIDGWWPHCYKPESHVFIEPWVGGRIWEQFTEDGQGGLYGSVLYIDEPRVLKCDGQWGMPGAAVSGGVWRFEEQDGGTLFISRGEIMGNLAGGSLEGREEGHRDVLLRLKHFVESGERIDRAAELARAEAEAAASAQQTGAAGQ